MIPQAAIAHYRISSKLGEGGMGAVYRATDTKLHRDVAIKVLPDAFARDPDRLARFTREAQVLASLNHPNIAAIYGVEERALVLELVEGPTLADRIAKGPIPVDESIAIARQIAEALEYAHERGIIHRDLKPSNIKVTPDGRVKVLDFGLAKAFGSTSAVETDPNTSPTMTIEATVAGVILGTAAYMSPEQARGKPVDRRADIWAFGVVLMEMLTGRPLYSRETFSETLAAVMLTEPDVSLLPVLPAEVRRLIRRCLTKDPRTRLRDIGEARIALELNGHVVDESTAARAAARPPARNVLPWTVAVVLLIAAVAVALVHFTERPADVRVSRFALLPPEKTYFTRYGPLSGFPSVSPDGRHISFGAISSDGKARLWLRTLDTLSARPLPGTEGAFASTFWSPDSRTIGFGVDGKLKKLDIAGGPPVTLADAPAFRAGQWSKEGTIVFQGSDPSALTRVPAAGGAVSPATKLDASRGEVTHRAIRFLPDGVHFLFQVIGRERNAVRIGSLDSSESKVLFENDTAAAYSEGYLLFVRDSTLLAQPFDLKSLVLTGVPIPIAEPVQHGWGYAPFTVARTGVLVYQSEKQSAGKSLTWIGRSGKRLGTVGDPAALSGIELSPDQRSAAVTVAGEKSQDVWIYDIVRGLRTRLTFGPAVNSDPIWSADGRHIVFSSNRSGILSLYRKAADGTGTEELLLSGSGALFATSCSPDGKFLLYNESPNGDAAIWLLPLAAGAKPVPLVKTPFNELNARFSPDGRWIAYQSDESGEMEIFVIPFHPDGSAPGARRQVSTQGGILPRWRRDGKELFYVAPDQTLMATEVRTKDGNFEIGQVTSVFGELIASQGFVYEVAADGQRVLAILPMTQSAPESIVVLQNWANLLKR